MSLDSIFEGLAVMESDPHKIWALFDQHFKANFFEPVIV